MAQLISTAFANFFFADLLHSLHKPAFYDLVHKVDSPDQVVEGRYESQK